MRAFVNLLLGTISITLRESPIALRNKNSHRKTPRWAEVHAYAPTLLFSEFLQYTDCSEMFKEEIKNYFGVDKVDPKSYIEELIRLRRYDPQVASHSANCYQVIWVACYGRKAYRQHTCRIKQH